MSTKITRTTKTRPKRIKMSEEATTSAAFIASATATPLPPRQPRPPIGDRVKLVEIFHQKATADRQPTQEDWVNSPILVSDTEEVIPSNQLVATETATIKREATEDNHSDSDNEFEELSLLTQYIGPPRQSRTTGTTERPLGNHRKEARITTEVTSFMETYSELIDTLDRARNHKESLTRATQRGRIPAKLRITTKPMVVNREDPKFVSSWERTIRRCELTLIKTITDHLEDTIQNTNDTIRETTKTAYSAIKDIDTPERAKKAIETALASAERERNLRAENRKRKREREYTAPPTGAATGNKKARMDNKS